MTENEVSANLVHFPISDVVVLKIKHAEECTIVFGFCVGTLI
jgi:hypothetical protein